MIINNIKVISELVRNNYKKIFIPLIGFLIINYFCIFLQLEKLGISPYIGITPVCGLLLGPYGAFGVSIAELIINLTSETDIIKISVGFILNFIYAYLPYKLWYYTIKENNEINTPNFNSVHNLFKFIIIILYCVFIYSIGTVILVIDTDIPNIISLDSIPLFLNSFIFTFLFGVFFIIVSNKCRINFVYPKLNKVKKKAIYYFPFLIINIISTVICVLLFNNNGNSTIWENISFISYIISLISLLIFLKCPSSKNINIEKKKHSSLIEKTIFIFNILTIIIMIIVVIDVKVDIFSININLGIGLSTLYYMLITLSLLCILGFSILYYIEKKITEPITVIAEASRNYMNSKKKESKSNSFSLIANHEEYINDNGEIGDLTNSFIQMLNDIEHYTNTIQEITSKKERVEAELNLATRIQLLNLPKDCLEHEYFKINAFMKAACEVGGDFYDFFMIDDNHLAIVIGDASGKGVPAALFTTIAKTLIKSHLKNSNSPESSFYKANNMLCENNAESMFVTAWAGVIDLNSRIMTFVNAGHNSPLIDNGSGFEWINEKHGLVLGAMDEIPYKEYTIQLNKGAKIFIYTDGVTEAHNTNDKIFGEKKLHEIINEKNLSEKKLIEHILESVTEFSNTQEQFDDITMLLLELK